MHLNCDMRILSLLLGASALLVSVSNTETLAAEAAGHALVAHEARTPIQCGETGGESWTCSMPLRRPPQTWSYPT